MRATLVAALCLAGSAAIGGCGAHKGPAPQAGRTSPLSPATGADRSEVGGAMDAGASLTPDLDRIFADPILARALIAVRISSLPDGRVLYAQNASKMVVPGSNLKIVTVAVAAARLGWDYRFETRLEAIGEVSDRTLHGDLVVAGSGDPSIGSADRGPSALFFEWADLLHREGIDRVDGRLIGDDDAFDDQGWGPGWAWDYLSAGYAAASGALSYNENVAVVRVTPAAAPGAPATVELTPPGHLLDIVNKVTTSAERSAPTLEVTRQPGSAKVTVQGTVPAGGAEAIRTASTENPTRVFVEAMRLALAQRGITVTRGAWDIDDLPSSAGAGAGGSAGARRVIARHQSEPLSALAGYAMKVSQNFYGETFLKAIGHAGGAVGSAESGRAVEKETLAAWGIPADAVVLYDGSG
ncbi:MAG: D-alanyl-D-alanine carboxypeptidase/D-alanyl-D-alanine-endopeptidase, partial [Acidobacteriota bacterium]